MVGQAADVLATAIAVDYVVHEGWVVYDKAPGMIVRYTLANGAAAPTKSSFQTFSSGYNYPKTIVMDLGLGNLLIGCNTIPGK